MGAGSSINGDIPQEKQQEAYEQLTRAYELLSDKADEESGAIDEKMFREKFVAFETAFAERLAGESEHVGLLLICGCKIINEDIDLQSLSDLENVSLCVEFWGLESAWPQCLFKYIASHIDDVKSWRDTSNSILAKHLNVSDKMLALLPMEFDFLTEVCKLGLVGWLEYGRANGASWERGSATAAAKGGHLECLQYAFFDDEDLSEDLKEDLYSAAAEGGHLSCISFLYENQVPFSYDLCNICAQANQLSCLEFIYKNGCKFDQDEDNTCSIAAEYGSLACLEFCHDNGCKWTAGTCTQAASGGHLSCLVYLHKNGCKWTANTCAAAAEGGHMLCLEFLHDNGCEWKASTCRKALAGGHFQCLEYAHKNGCELSNNLAGYACEGGSLPCLEYVLANGSAWSDDKDADYCAKAAIGGNVECLKLAHNNGSALSQLVCLHAARSGSVECLQYAFENGAIFEAEGEPTDVEYRDNVCAQAAEHGHLSCLEYAHSKGAPWNHYTTMSACSHGKLDCLKYALDNGCDKDLCTMYACAMPNTMDFLSATYGENELIG